MAELSPMLLSALIIGLLGSGHCLGMCGGLMGALTLAIPKEQKSRRLYLLFAYNIGRLASYACAGLLLGIVGWAVSTSMFASGLRIVAAILLILMGVYLAGWWSGLTYIERAGGILWKYLQPLTKRFMPVDSMKKAILMGMLWGWLPCGLVYSTLLWSTTQGNVIDSALLMLTFGLGTTPALIATGLAAERLTTLLQHKGVRMTSGILIILFGIWTFPGPHQHWLMGH